MKTRFYYLIWMLLIAYTGQSQYQFPSCLTPWNSSLTYNAGEQVSFNNANYEAKWNTTAAPRSDGSWKPLGKCGDGGLGPDYQGSQRIIGYLPYWVPNFDFANFNPSVVTHINVTFLLFQQNNSNFSSSNFASIAWADFHKNKVDSILTDLNLLNRAHQQGVTVSAAIGGATDYAFLWLLTQYYNNDLKLEEMADFIVSYVNATGLDGVDLDLECWWPDATIQGTTEQGGRVRGTSWDNTDDGPHPAAVGLTKLAQKLRQKMPDKLISAAVFGTAYYGNNYDDAIAEHLDWLGLMTYDFTGSWDTSPKGPHSALYKISAGTYEGQSEGNPVYSVQDALDYWMGMATPAWNHDGGFDVPKGKIVVGVPMYGYDFTTKKPSGNGYTFVSYKDIVASFPDAATSYDPKDTHHLGGFVAKDSYGIYYNTPAAAAAKIQYSDAYGHQGVIVWELTQDVAYNSGSSILKALNDAVGSDPNSSPVVAITSPSVGSAFEINQPVTIQASASDPDGTVTQVEFFVDGQSVGTHNSSPWNISYAFTSGGDHTLAAIATDNEGATTLSPPVSISVGSSQNPTVTIASPSNGASYVVGTLITIQASASPGSGSIDRVEFVVDGSVVGTDNSSPYSLNYTLSLVKSYSISAVAYNTNGGSTTSGTVTVSAAESSNLSPVISIISPSEGASFVSGISFAFTVSASDPDGVVTKVEFLVDGSEIAEDTSGPFETTVSGLSVGTHSLSAIVTDDDGATTTSAIITITVISGEGECNEPSYVEGGGYEAGSRVQNNGVVYECKPWPYSGWCDGGALAYAPGTGSNWQDAWIEIGTCEDGDNLAPFAMVNGPFSGAIGEEIAMNGVGSFDSDGSIVSYFWNFGDGATSGDVNTFHVYNTVGTFTVSLAVTDDDGATGIHTTTATITDGTQNIYPTAVANGPYNCLVGEAVSFSSIGSADADGVISGFSWSFGDGATSNEAHPTHTYITAGSYIVTLIVTDNEGGTGSATASVTITPVNDDCAPAWTASDIYVKDNIVTYNGVEYRAKWWTQNENPEQHSSDWDVWEVVGSCGSSARIDFTNFGQVSDLKMYPNPVVADQAMLSITLTKDMDVSVIIYNSVGQEISAIYNDELTTGVHELGLDTTQLKPGLYQVSIRYEGHHSKIKLIKR